MKRSNRRVVTPHEGADERAVEAGLDEHELIDLTEDLEARERNGKRAEEGDVAGEPKRVREATRPPFEESSSSEGSLKRKSSDEDLGHPKKKHETFLEDYRPVEKKPLRKDSLLPEKEGHIERKSPDEDSTTPRKKRTETVTGSSSSSTDASEEYDEIIVLKRIDVPKEKACMAFNYSDHPFNNCVENYSVVTSKHAVKGNFHRLNWKELEKKIVDEMDAEALYVRGGKQSSYVWDRMPNMAVNCVNIKGMNAIENRVCRTCNGSCAYKKAKCLHECIVKYNL